MARTFSIRDADSDIGEISLINTAAAGIIATRGGFQRSPFSPHQYDESRDLDDMLFVEQYQVNSKASDHDAQATQYRNLIKLLRKAWRFHNDPQQKVPVYLTQQTTNETNARYALVYQSPELSEPDFFDHPFETEAEIEALGINIARFIWTDSAPITLGTAKTLTQTDGPASRTKVQVSNFTDDFDISRVWVYEDGVGYSANLYGTGSYNLFPSPVSQNDGLVFGSTDGPVKHAVFPALSTVGDLTTTTLVFNYWNGSAWTALVEGDDYTVYPGADLEGCLEQGTDDIVFSVTPPSDFTARSAGPASDAPSGFYYFLREENAAPSYATTPVSNASDAAYGQRTPEIIIPTTALKGDVPAIALQRLYSPSGGDSDEAFSNISRIIIGAKRNPGNFVSHINLGGVGNSSDWAVTLGDDTTSDADPQAPGNGRATCDFASDTTMITRLTATGTGMLGDWEGEYRLFVRAQQLGGSASDTSIRVRTFIHESNDYSPKIDTETVSMEGDTQGLEVVDLGILKLPFGEVSNADSFTNADLIFQVQAQRTGGDSDITLRFYDLITIPIDEWATELEDPVIDTVNGTSALRGNSVLDDDGGVLANRTVKYINNSGTLYVAENWGRGGSSLIVDPETLTHLYFLMMHYPAGGTWGTGPLIGSLGCHLAYELYAKAAYLSLRGDD